MKKTPTELEPSAAWGRALTLFDRDLRRRGASEPTRHAYGVDLGQLALWATREGIEPTEVSYKTLRRYAAVLSERRVASSTVARKLAAVRSFFRALVEHGEIAHNPGDLLPAPKRAQRLPRALKADEVAALLDRIPATTALELRDRALFELAYACGLRAREIVDLDVESVDFDGEEIRVEGKGGKTRLLPVGESALTRRRSLPGAGAPRPERRGRRARAVPLEVRPAPLHQRRAPPAERLDAGRRGPGRGLAARAAALVRHAPSGGWGRPAQHSGASRAREHRYDPGLHSGRVIAPAGGVSPKPSAGITSHSRPPGSSPEEGNTGHECQGHRATGAVAPLQGERRPAGS